MYLKLVSRFSVSQFPYNFKGVQPINVPEVETFSKKCFGENINDGFLSAYQSFLETLVSPDCDEYLNEICDKKIGNAFLNGLSNAKKNGHNIKLTYNDFAKSAITYQKLQMHFFVDPNVDLKEQRAAISQSVKGQGFIIQMYNSASVFQLLKINRPILELSLCICSPCILALNDNDYNTQKVYHQVDFRTHSESTLNLMELQKFQPLKMNFGDHSQNSESMKYLFNMIGDDFSWKICNFDNFL